MNRKAKALQFATEEYNITITGRNVQVTDSMKDYAMEKISKIEKFSNRIIDVTVTMDIQKLAQIVDIVLKVDHFKIKSSAVTEDMYASIDRAVDRIIEQIRRYKDRLHDHQVRPLKSTDMNVNVLRPKWKDELTEINEEIEAENLRRLEEGFGHQIVKQEKCPLKNLTCDEAIMEMDLSGDAFMLFRCEDDPHFKLKLIYRREDGDYGVIEPEI